VKKPYTANSTDEKSIESSKKRVSQKKLLEESDVKSVLELDSGRRYVWRLLERCGIFRSGYVGGSEQLFFIEGRRDIGQKILNDILEIDPIIFTRMVEENKNGRRRTTKRNAGK